MTITYRDLGFRGRLGNALFQLAATIGIGSLLAQDVVFPDTWPHRKWFSVPDEMFAPAESLVNVPEAWPYLIDLRPEMDERARMYMQDLSLFSDLLPTIRNLLRPSAQAMEVINLAAPLSNPGPVMGVHVRRGDNVYDPGVPNKQDYFVCPDLDYYERGIDLLTHLYGTHPLLVCSDDFQWAHAHIHAAYYGNGAPALREHEEGFTSQLLLDHVDLFRLSQCDYLVLSNSTFGIWSALLADLPPNHVVRPDRVYGPALSYIDSDLMFDSKWKVVPVAAGSAEVG